MQSWKVSWFLSQVREQREEGKDSYSRAREVTQLLKALIALTEDTSSVPSTYVGAYNYL